MATTIMRSTKSATMVHRKIFWGLGIAILIVLGIMLFMQPAYAPPMSNDTTKVSDTSTTSTTMNRYGQPEAGTTDRNSGAVSRGPNSNPGVDATTDDGLTVGGKVEKKRKTLLLPRNMTNP